MTQLTLIGLPPSLPADREIPLARELAAYLSKQTTLPVEARVAAGYGELAASLADDSFDLAWLPPLEVARLCGQSAAEVLLTAVRGGLTEYSGVIASLPGSGVTCAAELEGKRIAWVDRRSASGYLMPAAELAKMSVRTSGPPTYAGSHAAAVRMLLEGEVDAAATYCNFDGGESGEPIGSGWAAAGYNGPVTIVLRSGPIPGDAVVASPGVSTGVRLAVRAEMARMHSDPEGGRLIAELFGADRFIEGDARGYEALTEASIVVMRPWTRDE